MYCSAVFTPVHRSTTLDRNPTHPKTYAYSEGVQCSILKYPHAAAHSPCYLAQKAAASYLSRLQQATHLAVASGHYTVISACWSLVNKLRAKKSCIEANRTLAA